MNLKANVLTCAGIVRYVKVLLTPHYKTPFLRTIWALSKGFLPESLVHYSDFTRYPYTDYVNDWSTYTKAIRINAGYNEVMNNKYMFYDLMKETGKTPAVYGYFCKGTPLYQDNRTDHSLDGFLTFVKEKNDLFFKRFEGGSGLGIFKISYEDGKYYIDRDSYSDDEVKKYLSSLHGYLFMECLYNDAEYAVKIYPNTLNTLKILTMIDPVTNQAFIAGAFQRFGTKASYPLDNMSKGGISCLVNIETGTLDTSYALDPVSQKEYVVEKHPETNEQILNIRLPHWDKIKEDILEIANRYSYLKYVAWDLMVTKDSIILIEGNANSETWGFQLGRPLLINPQVKAFYQYYKAIK